VAAADKGLERRGGLRFVDSRPGARPVANWPETDSAAARRAAAAES
jgi:hypothetical protein